MKKQRGKYFDHEPIVEYGAGGALKTQNDDLPRFDPARYIKGARAGVLVAFKTNPDDPPESKRASVSSYVHRMTGGKHIAQFQQLDDPTYTDEIVDDTTDAVLSAATQPAESAEQIEIEGPAALVSTFGLDANC